MVDGQVSTSEEMEIREACDKHVINWYTCVSFAVVIATGWLIIRLALLAILGIPDPIFHDEFSYLLGGDTFAHGRLTNPSHPLAAFFASPHILVEPTYSSKYPPGQALFLAAGQILFGNAFYGVILEGFLMIFLLSLMLCLWTSLGSAAVVSTALAIIFQPPMYWVDSYWGGCLAASGAAMLLIAMGWYRITSNVISGCVFAVGSALLFVTRPYEGGLFVLATSLIWAFTPAVMHTKAQRRRLIFAAAWGAPIVALAAVGAAAHNFAVTRSYLTIPYELHAKTFDVAPAFWFQPLRQPDPVYPTPRLAAQHGSGGWEVAYYRKSRGVRHGYLSHLLSAAFDVVNLLVFRFSSPAEVPILPLLLVGAGLIAGRVLFDRRGLICLALLAAGIVTYSLEVYSDFPHYWAPSLPAVVLFWGIVVERSLPMRIRGAPVGRVAVAIMLIMVSVQSVSETRRAVKSVNTNQLRWPHQRTEMIRLLSSNGKPNLVFVRYPTPAWNVVIEWVYNGADIDSQRVVFAHDLGTNMNRELLDYYKERTVWLLTFDPNDPDKYFLNPYQR